MVKYEEIDVEYWEQHAPPKKPGKSTKWDDALTQVEAGKMVRIEIDNENEKKGARIGISRRARSRDFKVDIREDSTDGQIWLLIRRSPETTREKATKPRKSQADTVTAAPTGKRRGRPPKNAPQSDE